MKVVQINATCGSGSTGRLCVEISKLLTADNKENYVFFASHSTNYNLGKKYVKPIELNLASVKSRLFGNWGFNTKIPTRRLLKQLKEINPDIVHLHNVHGQNVNITALFKYFKKNNTKLLWTFHDCWAFTAYCPHFDMIGCEKWKTECQNCPYRKNVSWFFDRSKTMFQRKKKLFSGLDLTVITPSQWLANLVKQSFLKEYPVTVINNGIDLSVFKPALSDFRNKYNVGNRYIVLGVAFDWDNRKGLDVFLSLANRLGDNYKVVLVGTNSEVDKLLPNNVISIHRTQNQHELAAIYTAADVFVNPTREENYPTVNMESIACGTPVVTFATGGSPEIVDASCGIVVPKNDVEAMLKAVQTVCEEKAFTAEACLEYAQNFDNDKRLYNYLALYRGV